MKRRKANEEENGKQADRNIEDWNNMERKDQDGKVTKQKSTK